ncbi:MCE family protein [Streptomyces sp. NPDC002574]|uniref:MCE family protein n=1 Tax=Streptomyces sp. NPDC002574 TaxID=3364652 RepID=UPI00369FA673
MRRVKAVLWAAAGAVLLTGCEFNGLYDVPLPGGAAADGHAYHVTVEFRDVLDLVPQSAVKVNNVTVGAVEEIELDGWHARVRLRVADSVQLPGNAVAELRQTSMLGEKYVSLQAPAGVTPSGRLGDGDVIPLSRSGRNPEIEEVLSALSALLNGGGVAQLHTITQELNKALAGREDRVKSLLKELDTFVGGLDDQKSQIVRALKGVDKLSRTLKEQRATIGTAVDSIPPALKILADQRRDLTRMLTSLSDLGKAGTKVIDASGEDVVANLRSLRPILTRLNQAGADLPNALELMTTYPFPRNVTDAIKGDYVNLKITADLDLKSLYGNLSKGPGGPSRPPGSGKGPGSGPLPELPPLPTSLPSLPGVPTVPAVPPVPTLPVPGPTNTSGGGALCPPVCLGSQASYDHGTPTTAGVDWELAGLMTRGLGA